MMTPQESAHDPKTTPAMMSRRSWLGGVGALAASFSIGGVSCSTSSGVRGAATPISLTSATPVTTSIASASSSGASSGGPRSLVCVMLRGGADSFNMFCPLDSDTTGSDYAAFARTRGELSVNANDLLGFGDNAFGIHPGLPGLAARGAEGRLAVVTNVGPLTRPSTRDDVLAERDVPQALFAHDAQQKLWQTARPTLTSATGWGGSIGEIINRESAAAAALPPSFSIAGSNHWLSARTAPYSQLSPTVQIERMRGYDAELRSWIPSSDGLESVMQAGLSSGETSANPFIQAASERLTTSIRTTELLQEATRNSPENDVGMDIGQNRLALRLRRVAQLIRNREQLGMERQIFFVHMGGWDTHGEQADRFPPLLAELDGALSAFQTSLDAMGVAETVTTFTMSDFGRTLTSNGDGTDHGWGGHAFVMGGAVEGGQYGTIPNFTGAGNPDDAGDVYGNFAGRIIPTTSVSQYGATLARWMGMDEAALDASFPELSNFERRDLGFFRA